uniref:Uncharacterized protein n=1 Tax=Nelumbo nucifera TaxID=4432 RepID=A0A822YJU2_NELNU|nr:TPA_asm: hypothetical protein HUJ06_010430 [Nelumbo nucifera]
MADSSLFSNMNLKLNFLFRRKYVQELLLPEDFSPELSDLVLEDAWGIQCFLFVLN